MFGWIDVKDSSGIPVSDYFIAVDQGNAFSVLPGVGDETKSANIALAPILELEYGLFKITCQVALWIIGYGLSFKWLDFIAKPFDKLGQATEGLTHNIGILTLALTLAGGVAAFAVVRGRSSKAAYQIGSAIVITALMASIFAHPMAALVGSNGYLAKARDVGISISAGITRGTAASPAGSAPTINELQTALADGFVRTPTQILNFNANADANGCKGVWNAGIRSGDRDKLKDTIAKCGASGKKMKGAADHLTGDRLASAAAMLLLSAILLAFGCYLMGKIILTVVLALTNAIMLPVVGTLGVVAGGFQGMAFKCLCNLALALIKIPLTVVYAGAYAALLGAMLRVDGNPIQILLLSTILLIVAIVAFRRIEAGVKNGHGNILSFLNRGGSAELPKSPPSPLARRSTALALQAGGAALGVPPTLTGLAVGAGRSLRNHGGGRGAHLAASRSHGQQPSQHDDPATQQQWNQWWQHQQHATTDQQQPTGHITGDPAAAPAASTPPADPPQVPVSRVTQVLRQAPALHPDVATAIGAMPQQIQPAASLPPVPHQPSQPSRTPQQPPRSAPAASMPASPESRRAALHAAGFCAAPLSRGGFCSNRAGSCPHHPPQSPPPPRAADIVNRPRPH
jgi:hypothetical protein